MSEPKRIPPVSLPAGSFELSELDKAISAAVSVEDHEKHPERIQKAIATTIAMPEILANLDRPAVPAGADYVERRTKTEKGDTVVTHELAFKPAKGAETGTEAAEMVYEPTTGKAVDADEVVTTTDAADTPTLIDAAAAVVEKAEDAKGKSGK